MYSRDKSRELISEILAELPRSPEHQNRLLTLAFETTDDAIYVLQARKDRTGSVADFIIKLVNHHACDQMSMPSWMLIDRGICELFPVNLENGFFDQYKKVYETGETLNQDYFIPEKYPGAGWYNHRVYASPDGVIIFNRCITEEKKRLEALQESEERFRSLVNSLSDVVFTLDTEMRHTGVYGDWVEKSGLSPEYFLGKRARDLFGIEASEIHEEMTAKALKGERISYEWNVHTPAGTQYFQTALSPVFSGEGKVTGVAGVARDITHLKELEAALKSHNEKLTAEKEDQQNALLKQSRFAEMGAMLDSLIHSWRQPLQAVAMTVQYLPDAAADGKLDQKSAEKFMNDIMDQVEVLSRSLDRFRNIFKSESVPVKVQPYRELQKVWEIIADQMESIGVTLFTEGDLELTFNGYPGEFRQVLLNLLNNSRRIFEVRKIKNPFIKVKIYSASKTDESICITVSDNGGGIEDVLLPNNLFKPYFTHGSRCITGTGLAITRAIIESQMHGKITAYNTEDGAGFCIELPVRKTD